MPGLGNGQFCGALSGRQNRGRVIRADKGGRRLRFTCSQFGRLLLQLLFQLIVLSAEPPALCNGGTQEGIDLGDVIAAQPNHRKRCLFARHGPSLLRVLLPIHHCVLAAAVRLPPT